MLAEFRNSSVQPLTTPCPSSLPQYPKTAGHLIPHGFAESVSGNSGLKKDVENIKAALEEARRKFNSKIVPTIREIKI